MQKASGLLAGFEVIRGSQWEGQGVQGDSPAFRQPRFSFQAGLYQMSAADLQDPPTVKVPLLRY